MTLGTPADVAYVPRYELPYRLHISKVYPLRSINGSAIVVCGHEHGISIVWRGGRPFKGLHTPARKKTPQNH